MKTTKTLPIVVLLLGVFSLGAFAQSAGDISDIRRDLDAVRDALKLIQNDLEVIKKLVQQQPPAVAPQPQAFKETSITIDGAPFLGQENAKVTLVEFSDYQCPFCKRNFEQTFPQIENDYVKTGKVRYVFRNFPLESMHPVAFKASEAALCAGEQGKYWEMHSKLFANQAGLPSAAFAAYATSAGLDETKFKQCLESGRNAAKIRSDLAEGRKAGLSGTPGFFLGLTQPNVRAVTAVRFINGAQPYANFKDAIEQLLATK